MNLWIALGAFVLFVLVWGIALMVVAKRSDREQREWEDFLFENTGVKLEESLRPLASGVFTMVQPRRSR